MMTDYLRKVVERLSQMPAAVQDRYAAGIEVDLNQEERAATPTSPAIPGIPETPEIPPAEPAYNPATDPLAAFIGSVHSGTPDLAQRHDAYLAEAHADDHSK